MAQATALRFRVMRVKRWTFKLRDDSSLLLQRRLLAADRNRGFF